MRPTVVIKSPQWKVALPRPTPWARNVVKHLCACLERSISLKDQETWNKIITAAKQEVVVVLADDETTHHLNQTYRSGDYPANVLSFPDRSPYSPSYGDVILSYTRCHLEAETQGKSFGNHTTHLLLHGILHLLGYDHKTSAQASVMEAVEIQVLKELFIENPYV